MGNQHIPQLGDPGQVPEDPPIVSDGNKWVARLAITELVMYLGALIFIIGIFMLEVWVGLCVLGIGLCVGAVYTDVVRSRKAGSRS